MSVHPDFLSLHVLRAVLPFVTELICTRISEYLEIFAYTRTHEGPLGKAKTDILDKELRNWKTWLAVLCCCYHHKNTGAFTREDMRAFKY